MPAAAAGSSWSGGQPSRPDSSSPVRTGLCARTRSPVAAIAASSAAPRVVLPTPVPVPVISSPRTSALGLRSGGASDLGVALAVEGSARPGRVLPVEGHARPGRVLAVEGSARRAGRRCGGGGGELCVALEIERRGRPRVHLGGEDGGVAALVGVARLVRERLPAAGR